MNADAPREENREYRRLLAQLYAKDDDALYQQLMQREQRVLDVVNRVANDARGERVRGGQFVNMPVAAVVQRFYEVMREVARDLSKARTLQHLVNAVRRDDRVIFVGLLLVLVAMFLLLIQSD